MYIMTLIPYINQRSFFIIVDRIRDILVFLDFQKTLYTLYTKCSIRSRDDWKYKKQEKSRYKHMSGNTLFSSYCHFDVEI